MNIQRTVQLVASTAIIALSTSVLAKDALHNTKWQTIDDDSGKPKAIIKITEKAGKLEGVIEKSYDYKKDEPCKKCKGKYKNKPLVGAKILWNLKPTDKNEYAGGKILDPKNGKDYKLKGKLTNNGKVLELRGYIGTPLLGRTQKWKRLN